MEIQSNREDLHYLVDHIADSELTPARLFLQSLARNTAQTRDTGEDGTESLRQDVTAGLVDIREGRFTAFNVDNLDELATRVNARGRKRLQKSSGTPVR